ncbi:hypothetical protein PFISCL1PPCAC_26330, partial [Pristionchus fissidentatus]
VYSIGHEDYSVFKMVRDGGGFAVMLFLIITIRSDIVLRARYSKELVPFVGLLTVNRFVRSSQSLAQEIIDGNLPVPEYFCTVLFYCKMLIHNVAFMFAIYLSIQQFLRHRSRPSFSGLRWVQVTTVHALVIFTVHLFTGKEIRPERCCCVNLNMDMNYGTAIADIIIHAVCFLSNMIVAVNARAHNAILPFSLVSLSVITMFDLCFTVFPLTAIVPKSLPNFVTLIIFFSRGEIYILVSLLLLILLDRRFRIVVSTRFVAFFRRQKYEVEQDLLGAEIE